MTGPAFTMLGDPDAVACEGDVCLVPGAAQGAQESRVAPATDPAPAPARVRAEVPVAAADPAAATSRLSAPGR